MTAGTPAATRASRMASPGRWCGPGRRCRPAGPARRRRRARPGGPRPAAAVMSATRSAVIRGRSSATLGTRSASGGCGMHPRGAGQRSPGIGRRQLAGRGGRPTGRTTISGSPSAAPPISRSRPSSRAWSLRQLVASVRTWSACRDGVEVAVDVGAAERVDRLLGVADQDHRAGARGRPGAGSPTGSGRCPGTRRPSPPGSGPGAEPPPPRRARGRPARPAAGSACRRR